MTTANIDDEHRRTRRRIRTILGRFDHSIGPIVKDIPMQGFTDDGLSPQEQADVYVRQYSEDRLDCQDAAAGKTWLPEILLAVVLAAGIAVLLSW